MEIIRLPKLGMDMEEGRILRWMKNEGESVVKGEPIAEMETDKSTMELEAVADGILLKLLVPEDESVPVGTPVAVTGEAGENAEEFLAAQTGPEKEPAPEIPVRQEAKVSDREAGAISVPEAGACRIRISPRARKLAEINGIDITGIKGTGPNGRIVEKDVRTAMEHACLAGCRPGVDDSGFFPEDDGRIQDESAEKMTGIRHLIAERMHASLSEMAQANHRTEADAANLIAIRRQMNADPAEPADVTYMDFLIAACARAIAECPYINVSLENGELRKKPLVNIGIAVDTARGLVVPVLRNAAARTVSGISKESRQLIDRARQGTLLPEEMRGGTFTISNLGMYPIDSFTAVINPPESAILAVGRIREKPAAADGEIVIRPVMTLSLTYDHRVIDGAPAARFLARVLFYLENPALLLLPRRRT